MKQRALLKDAVALSQLCVDDNAEHVTHLGQRTEEPLGACLVSLVRLFCLFHRISDHTGWC